MLLTSGQISVAISSGVGKLPLPPPNDPKPATLTHRSLHLHNPPVPLRLHTATADRALTAARPAPAPDPRHPRHRPGPAETFRATPGLRRGRVLLRQVPGEEQAAGGVGEGGVCAAGAPACGGVRGGDGDAGGGAGGEYGAEDHSVSAGMGWGGGGRGEGGGGDGDGNGDGDGEEEERRRRETSGRLLRKAAREYKVMLQAVGSIPLAEGSEAVTEEERYPLTNLLSLIHYNRILFLRPSGLILDSTPLDLLFTLPMEQPLLGLSAPEDETMQPAILLFEPSKETYRDVTSSLPEGAYPDNEFLQRVTTTPAPADGESPMTLLAQTSALGDVDAQFNATRFLDTTAYVRLSDPGLPGPEYDIPRQDYVRAMPGSKEARRAWEGVYERFRDARMGICGLDLERVERQRSEMDDVVARRKR